jgi:hypothetical protein
MMRELTEAELELVSGGIQSGLFNALFLDWVSPKCHTLTQTAIG